jgi:4-carboxymuconolactone decarboxylase
VLSGDADRRRHALGARSDDLMAAVAALDPQVAEWVDDFVFGAVWGRAHLATDERRLVAISMLAAGGHLPQLRNYLHGALQAGIPREKLREVLVMSVPYVGFPSALASLGVFSEVCAAEDRAAVRGG